MANAVSAIGCVLIVSALAILPFGFLVVLRCIFARFGILASMCSGGEFWRERLPALLEPENGNGN